MAILRVPVNITWTGPGSPGVNVWHIRSGGATVTDPMDDLATQGAVDAIHAFYNDMLTWSGSGEPAYATGTKITLGNVVDVSTQEVATPTFAAIGPVGSSSSAAPALQVCISWKTSIAARRGRGRTFFGPLHGNIVQSDGSVVEAFLTDLRTAAQTLVDSSKSVNNWAVGIWGQQSMMSGSAVTPAMRRAAPHVFRDITGFSIRDQFAVLRSRRD